MLCEVCNQPLSEVQVSRKFKYCSRKCYYASKTLGYDTEFLNEENEFSAYFIGFWVGDGTIKSDGHIEVCNCDREVIDIIVDKTKYVNSVREDIRDSRPNSQPNYVLTYYNKPAWAIQSYFNVTNKKGPEQVPAIVSNNTFNHFIRGLFDADGCFTLDNRSFYLMSSIMLTSKECLEDILNRLKELKVVRGGSIHPGGTKNAFYLSFSHQDSVSLGYFMYSNATILMSRKKNIWLEHKDKELTLIRQEEKCLVDSCPNTPYSKNLCKNHYVKARKFKMTPEQFVEYKKSGVGDKFLNKKFQTQTKEIENV